MYTSPPEKSGILHLLHWSQMSSTGVLSDEDEGNASFHLPAPVFIDAEGEGSGTGPLIEEGIREESAKLVSLQAEIIAQQAELAASQSAAKQVAPADHDAVSSTELRGFMQQIAAGFGAMKQENTTRKVEWEEFQQRVDAERVELTAVVRLRGSRMVARYYCVIIKREYILIQNTIKPTGK